MRPAPRAPATLGALCALLASASMAAAVGVHEPGAPLLHGVATDLVERRALLDLWDAGEPRRAFVLRLAPDSDPVPGVEARWRPVNGTAGTWGSLEQARVQAHGERAAQDRGWDGLYELQVRLRLPNQPAARLALLVVEEAPGRGALALTTRLEAATLRLHGAVEEGPGGARLVARPEGPKAPAMVEALDGARRTSLAAQPDGTWHGQPPPGAAQVRLAARFADGGTLEGPVLDLPAPTRAEPAPPGQAPAPARAPAPAWLPRGAPAAPAGSTDPTPPEPPEAPKRAPTHAAAQPERATPGPPISLALAGLVLVALWGARGPPPSFKPPSRIEEPVGPCTRPRFASR